MVAGNTPGTRPQFPLLALTDARTLAKRYSLSKLQVAFIDRGMPIQRAYAKANYLKNNCTFQTLCEVEFKLKNDKK